MSDCEHSSELARLLQLLTSSCAFTVCMCLPCCLIVPQASTQDAAGDADGSAEQSGAEGDEAGADGSSDKAAAGEQQGKSPDAASKLPKLSKLNPNAKPFTLNINAKPFVPPGTSSTTSSVAGYAATSSSTNPSGTVFQSQGSGAFSVDQHHHQQSQQQHYSSGGGMMAHGAAAYTHMLATGSGHLYAVQPGMVPPGLAQGGPQHVAAVQGMQQAAAAAAAAAGGPPPGLAPAAARMGQPPPPGAVTGA